MEAARRAPALRRRKEGGWPAARTGRQGRLRPRAAMGWEPVRRRPGGGERRSRRSGRAAGDGSRWAGGGGEQEAAAVGDSLGGRWKMTRG